MTYQYRIIVFVKTNLLMWTNQSLYNLMTINLLEIFLSSGRELKTCFFKIKNIFWSSIMIIVSKITKSIKLINKTLLGLSWCQFNHPSTDPMSSSSSITKTVLSRYYIVFSDTSNLFNLTGFHLFHLLIFGWMHNRPQQHHWLLAPSSMNIPTTKMFQFQKL